MPFRRHKKLFNTTSINNRTTRRVARQGAKSIIRSTCQSDGYIVPCDSIRCSRPLSIILHFSDEKETKATSEFHKPQLIILFNNSLVSCEWHYSPQFITIIAIFSFLNLYTNSTRDVGTILAQ